MKIIVAEDDEVTLLLISEKLRSWGYEVLCVEDGKQALDLAEANPDIKLFLVDWQMPNMNGIEFCKAIKNKNILDVCYIMILTSKNDTEDIVAALESGADDFLSKPFAPDELKVRLKVGERIVQSESLLLHKATHDPLTDVLNHRAIIEELNNLWMRSLRDKSTLSVLMLDLDHFKRINDTYGHQAGDYVLKQFCGLVISQIRPYDKFGRYGGEEFVVILPSADADQAFSVAERIRTKLDSRVFEYDGMCINVSVSIGISSDQHNTTSYKDLILQADKAAYQSKNGGRNRTTIYNENSDI